MKIIDDKGHVNLVQASEADLAVLRASQPSDYAGVTGFSRMTVYERLQWLDMAVMFVAKVATPNGSDARNK